jgi:uncharacterized membrane protein YbhN (UPF0104 family)
MNILIDVLFLFSGILIHMSFLHLFSYYETHYHPIISRSKNPYRASKFWGIFQLLVGMIILYLCKYELGRNLPTLFVLIGFCVWGIFLGVFAGKHFKKDQ